MPDGDVAAQRDEDLLVEDLADEPEVLEHDDLVTVRDGDASRFLPTVLERVQTVVGELRHFLTWGPDPEHSAFFAGFGFWLVGVRKKAS
ncbi:hypothetical protein Acsp05_13110 [Actinokineospora sp. NBRC 105648]|nr:hypothetical protein Acsp05_13110 [Actinokineospora sp. NBRC 105648]